LKIIEIFLLLGLFALSIEDYILTPYLEN